MREEKDEEEMWLKIPKLLQCRKIPLVISVYYRS